MACYWIALIPLRCSGNQATILLEALVLMANLVDLMVGSIQLGVVGTREGEHSVPTIYQISQSTEAFEPKGSSPAVVSSLLLDPQAYYSLRYSPQSALKTLTSTQVVLEVNASIYKPTFDSHQIYSLYYVRSPVGIESITQSPSLLQSTSSH